MTSGKETPDRARRKSSAASEAQLISVLSRVFEAGPELPPGALGIGDDAACLSFNGKLVVSVDGQVEGTHFRRDWLGLGDIGYRSFQAAISDLAAMGAVPVAAVSHLTLPRGFSAAELRQLTRGQARAAAESSCPVVGGNLSRGAEISVVTTVMGKATRCLTRAGAKPGDELWLVGELGLARAGFELVSRRSELRSPAAKRALRAWRRPRALLAAGAELVGRARACLDVSDGLARDVHHLAEASDVHIEVHGPLLRATLSSALERVAQDLAMAPLALALEGGEDYALLATGPARRRPAEAKVIGIVCAGSGASLFEDSRRRPLHGGFDHFS